MATIRTISNYKVKMGLNSSKLSKIVQICQNCQKYSLIIQNDPKLSEKYFKLVKNGTKRFKWFKMSNITQIGLKGFKRVQYITIWSIMVKNRPKLSKTVINSSK